MLPERIIMSVDRSQSQDRFDRMLRGGLCGYKETVRADFADDVINCARLQAQQRLLKKVIWQERLALTGCILIPVAAIAAILIFPQIIGTFSEWTTLLCGNIARILVTGKIEWQKFAVYAAAAGVAVYSIFDLFFAEG